MHSTSMYKEKQCSYMYKSRSQATSESGTSDLEGLARKQNISIGLWLQQGCRKQWYQYRSIQEGIDIKDKVWTSVC